MNPCSNTHDFIPALQKQVFRKVKTHQLGENGRKREGTTFPKNERSVGTKKTEDKGT